MTDAWVVEKILNMERLLMYIAGKIEEADQQTKKPAAQSKPIGRPPLGRPKRLPEEENYEEEM